MSMHEIEDYIEEAIRVVSRSDMPVSTCNHFREVSPVKGDYERQPVEFPGEPYGFAAGPLDQIFGFLRLRQREGRKFMSLACRLSFPGWKVIILKLIICRLI